MRPRVIFIHGNGATHWSFAWTPWLKEELERHGYRTAFETFPDSVIARSEYWLPFLQNHLKAGANDIIIGWSSGAVAAMRYAETQRIKGSILVAPCSVDLGDELEKQSGYFTDGWNWESIRKNQEHIAVVHSDNDPFIPEEQFHLIAKELEADVVTIPNGKHFIERKQFPEVLGYILKTYPVDKTVSDVTNVFIDASNLWAAQKAKGKNFDYEKLTDYIRKKFKAASLQVFYYTAFPAEGTRTYSLDPRHRFFTFLKKGLGFEVRKKELKRIAVTSEHGERIQEKGNMDVEITIDALHTAEKYDTAIFFTGDSDFLALVSYLRSIGKNVFIFSSKNNVSQELRTGADGYFDVLTIEDDIWGKELKYRTEKSS